VRFLRRFITEYDAINKTVTGTFKFSAENTDSSSQANATVNFQQGVFIKFQ
jgi:phage protein D